MRILLIETDVELVQRLSRTLREHGFAVDSASDGETGLCYALRFHYDAVILDAQLTRLDSWDVLACLRKTKNPPLLMLCAQEDIDARVTNIATGPDHYLVKPIDVGEMLARLRGMFNRHAVPG